MKLYSKTLNKGSNHECEVVIHLCDDKYHVVKRYKNAAAQDLYNGKDSVQATTIYENSVTWN